MALDILPNGTESTTPKALIDWIPDANRTAFLQSLVRSLRTDDSVSINFVASLVVQEPDDQVEADFLFFLGRSIEDNNNDSGVDVCSRHPQLGVKLLEKAVRVVAGAAEVPSQAKFNPETSYTGNDPAHFCLEFLTAVISILPFGTSHVDLFYRCLDLMTTTGGSLSTLVFTLVLKMFNLDDHDCKRFIADQSISISDTITALVKSTSKDDVLQGYSLWLRYVIAVPYENWRDSIDHEYWQKLLHGLRHGDSERRKLCLNIIKLSFAADQSVVPNNVRHQYERYCTVFETIVLGRYINQIQECEADLNVLANDHSTEPRWLYVLLASALDPQMQESNRKFIGNWIMQSKLKPNTEFMDFFREEFIPWAMQGHLFVSSLKNDNGVMHCAHGDSLASFIKQLQTNGAIALADIIIEAIHRKCNTIFAYAAVYLLEGVKDLLRPKHVSQIAAVRALPEVARDYVKLQATTIGGHATEAKSRSRREIVELAALDKCVNSHDDVEALNEIWADVEYLEHPKRLLMALPKALLSSGLTAAASRDPILATSLNKKLRTLQNAGSTKQYFFPPLVAAVRQAILTNPSAAAILPVADFIIHIAEHPPGPTIDLMLEEASIHLTPYKYEDYFGKRPSYGFASLLDLVGRLIDHQTVVESILNHVVLKWKTQKVPPPIVSTWKNTLQLQVLLLCLEQYHFESITKVQELLESLFHILAVEPLARYRYLLEVTIVRLISRFRLEDTIIERLNTKDHHGNPKHLASLMKIGTMLTRRSSSTGEFAQSLAAMFVPLAASSKVVIRHEAQWQFPILIDCCRAKALSAVTENPAYLSLESHIRSQERFSDPFLERRVGTFDPDKDFTLSNLVAGQWFDLDQMEQPRTTYDDFVKLYAEDLPLHAPATCIPLGSKIQRTTPPASNGPNAQSSVGTRTATKSTALQTKGSAYLSRTLSDHTKRPHDLLVVGSLVDNPYNLGGLSRVAEIFGASGLTLQNQTVVSNHDFTSVSVSSHLHYPLTQLSAPNIPSFLTERKSEGYTVVGIEQTDRSVMLGSEASALPKKVVLVVGSEKEGIPAAVLTECDVLVEIPQMGVTRSLNVQTAVAIVLFEYVRQHGKNA